MTQTARGNGAAERTATTGLRTQDQDDWTVDTLARHICKMCAMQLQGFCKDGQTTQAAIQQATDPPQAVERSTS
eukprot:8038864-Alexandrium_andersonii.AAC.1